MPRSAMSKKERVNMRRRRRRQFVGLLVSFFVVVGVITIVSSLFNYVSLLFNNTAEKDTFQELIAPLVALDPTPFSSIDKANQDTLLEAAIWAVISGEDTTKYSRNEDGMLVLPAVDVENYWSKIYGPSHPISHRSFNNSDIRYEYSTDRSGYIIPATSLGGAYKPVVEDITTSGNYKILTVAYAQPSGSVDGALNPDTLVLREQRMEYVMIKTSGQYYLYAIRYPEKT